MVRNRMVLIVGAHAMLFSLALLSAFLLAYNFRFVLDADSGETWVTSLYLPLLFIALPVKLLIFWWTQQYHGSWRYVSLRDIFGVVSSSLIASSCFLLIYFVLTQSPVGPMLVELWPQHRLRQSSVFLLDWAATVGFVAAARVFVRFYFEDIHGREGLESKRALICGAGDAGEAVLREMLRMRHERFECVGFLDDDRTKLHARIHDVEVIGTTAELREHCARYGVEEVFIAMPTAGPRRIRELVESCEGLGVRFRTIPAVADLIEGRVQVSQMRDVEIGDLLGRDVVELDKPLIAAEIRDRVVLVTGAGGSIGSEMCRQIGEFGPKKLILVERAENNLFEIHRELRGIFAEIPVTPCVADIADAERVRAILSEHSPSIVFHAAAHKHVPMMEWNPGEAIKNNVVGTMTVADAAIDCGVEKMVMISTDKAVNPTSIMGCSKRVAEMYVQCRTHEAKTQFVTVRFGNVLGSSGSVVPIFKKQIAAGGPVTVTDPEMTRYFMTIPEAAQLVLQAGAMGRGGEIYVLRMGEPVRIVTLARDMITLSGLRPEVDIEIVFSGRRPGEKLYEELSGAGEGVSDTAHPKIGIWTHKAVDLDELRRGIDKLVSLSDGGSAADIKAGLLELVPEFTPDAEEAAAMGQSTPAPQPVSSGSKT